MGAVAERSHIAWHKGLETGIPVIDGDHKVLVSLLNQVSDTIDDNEDRATLGSVLNSLSEYTQYHFLREETLLEAAGYAGLEAHRALHRSLAAEVEATCQSYAESPDAVQKEDVRSFLRTWLVEHIQHTDMNYRDAVLAVPDAILAAEKISFGDTGRTVSSSAPIKWADIRILVVEDNLNFQLIIKTILKAVGVRDILVVDNGFDGLDLVRKNEVDLVLCDWRMDQMDGVTFIKEARLLESTARIILMSGYGGADLVTQAEAAGANGYLEKPITARGFLETAAQALA